MDVYAGRILHLRSLSHPLRQISIGIRSALVRRYAASCREGQQERVPLLPKLRSLAFSWDGQDQSTALLASALASPLLHNLEININVGYANIDVPSFKGLMKEFSRGSPNLHQILLTFDNEPPSPVTDAIPHLLRHMSELRSFKCRLSPGLAIVMLAGLSQLTELSIPLPRSLKDGSILYKYTSKPFQKLQYLHCRSGEIQRSITFLGHIQSTSLSKVTLTTDARKSTLSELADYFRVLSSRESIKEIVVQKLARPTEAQTPADTSILTYLTIAPLLQLRGVTTLAISAGFAVDLNGGSIKLIAETWPQLYRLSILSERPTGRRSGIPMDSLIIFIQNCPALDSLGLTFDPTLPSDETRATLDTLRLSKPDLGCSLFKISVLNCTQPNDPSAVGKFIHDVFPECHLAVEDDVDASSEVDPRVQSWQEVRRHVRQLRRDRRALKATTSSAPEHQHRDAGQEETCPCEK